MLTTKLLYLPNALTLALDIILHMVASSKNTGGSTSEDTISVHLVPGSRRGKGEKRRKDVEDAGSATRGLRASTSEAPAPGNKKKKAKKFRKRSKNEKTSAQDTMVTRRLYKKNISRLEVAAAKRSHRTDPRS